MADIITIGTNPNDGTGDDLRTAFKKVNAEFARLAQQGGGSTTAENVGLGQGLFLNKVDNKIQLKSIKSGNSALTITTDGNDVVLTNTNPAQNVFTRIQGDAGDASIDASSSNSVFGIKGGANVTTTISGNDIQIDLVPDIVLDTTPQLGGTLDLNNNNITGTGSIDISGNLTIGGNFNVGNIVGDIKGSVFGDDSTPIVDSINNTLNGDLTGDVTGNVTGNITGNISGGISSDFNINEFGINNTTSGTVGVTTFSHIRTALGNSDVDLRFPDLTNPATLNNDTGLVFRLKDQESLNLEVQGSTNDLSIVPLSMVHYTYSSNDITDGYEQLIGSGYVTDGETEQNFLGAFGYRVENGINKFVVRVVEHGQFIGESNKIGLTGLEVWEDQSVVLDGTFKFKDNEISTLESNEPIKINPAGTGSIDFYGNYEFPRSIGNAGEVLKVPSSGTLLEWGVGGGGAVTSSIASATATNPVVITTSTAHGLTDQQQVTITDVLGMTELNGNSYYVDVINATTINLYDDDALSTSTDGTGFTAYTSGGFVTGSAGGGSGTFVGLGDTPTSFAGAAGDADKLVQVNAAGNALEFTDFNTIIDSTYIEGKGFMPKSGGTFTGTITVDDIIATDANVDLATSGIPFRNVYAQTFTGDLTGDVTGDVTGNVTGNLTGDVTGNVTGNLTGNVTANSGTSTFNDVTLAGNLSVTTGSITANVTGNITGNVSGNVTGNTTGVHNGNVNATSGTSVFNIINVASASATGNITANSFTGDITSTGTSGFNNVSITGNITNSSGTITIADTLTVTGATTFNNDVTVDTNLDVAGQIDLGDLRITSNNIETQTSNSNLRIAANGTGFIELEGDIRLNGPISYSGIDSLLIGGTQNPYTISLNSPVTMVTINDFISPSSGLAFANLGAGTEGQIKTIKVIERGQYSTDGGITNFDRHLELNLTINGAVSTYNISQGANNEHGAVTLVYHGSSWYVLNEYIES